MGIRTVSAVDHATRQPQPSQTVLSVGTGPPARMLAGVHARETGLVLAFLQSSCLLGRLGRLGAFKDELPPSLASTTPSVSTTTKHFIPLPFAQCCLTAKMAPVRRAPYKDFLQPALHRRFTSTATILLAIAFVEAVVFASWDSRESCPSPGRAFAWSQSANALRPI